MLLIECPYCGPRNGTEFTFLGKARTRPGADTTRTEWRRYLYEEDNVAGFGRERWFHVNGCRKFIEVERHSLTNEISFVRTVGDA